MNSTYNLQPNSKTVSDGSSNYVLLTTTSLPSGYEVDYTISGIPSSYLSTNSLTGSAIINAQGQALIPINIIGNSQNIISSSINLTLQNNLATTSIKLSTPNQTNGFISNGVFNIQSAIFWDQANFNDGALSDSDLKDIAIEFQDYKNLGTNSITVTWGVPVNENTGDLVNSFNINSPLLGKGLHFPTLDEITQISKIAKSLGLSVILKPQANTMDAQFGTNGTLPDNIYSSSTGPKFDANTFLSQWATYMSSVAKVAQQVGAVGIVIGTENAGFDTTQYLTQWQKVVDNIKQSFTGFTTYAAFRLSNVALWKVVDIIGIDAYYPLTTNQNPTYSDALSGWTKNSIGSTLSILGSNTSQVNIVSYLKNLSSQYNKPLYFSEFGGMAGNGVLSGNSGTGGNGNGISFQQQEYLYGSMYEALSLANSDNWFLGASLWQALSPYDSPTTSQNFNPNISSFDIRGRLAGEITASWFGSTNFLQSNQNSFTGSLANDKIALYGQTPLPLPKTLSNPQATQQSTFSLTTNISITLSGTIINNTAESVHFYINGIDQGIQNLNNTWDGNVLPSGNKYDINQTFTFQLSGTPIINQIKIATEGSVANNQLFKVISASVNKIPIVNGVFYPQSSSNLPFTISSVPLINSGYALLDASSYNDSLANPFGSSNNPISINGGGGSDCVFVLGSVSQFTFKKSGNNWILNESIGLNQNAVLTSIAQVNFQDGSQVPLMTTLSSVQNSVMTFSDKSSNYGVTISGSTLTILDSLNPNDFAKTAMGINRLKFSDSSFAYDLQGSQSGGLTAELLGAAFGPTSLTNKQYVGIGLGLFDGGLSMTQVAQLAINTGAISAPDNTSFVKAIWANVMGSPVDSGNLNSFVGLLNNGTYTQAGLLSIAATTSTNQNHINLVGLAQSGLQYS